MNRLKTVLKDRSGQGTPMILAVVVCCLILACVVFEYMRLMIVAQGVRDSVQSAIVAVATENWDEAYPGLREGYSGGYQLSGSSWTKNVTTGNVYDRLQQVLGLVYEDGRYLKYAGPDLEYRFYDLRMELENAPFASVGGMIPPCGVPSSVGNSFPLNTAPHFNHFLSIVLSIGIFSMSQSWLMWSKQPFISPSKIHSGECWRFKTVSI